MLQAGGVSSQAPRGRAASGYRIALMSKSAVTNATEPAGASDHLRFTGGAARRDRKSVGEGKRVDLRGRRIIKKKKRIGKMLERAFISKHESRIQCRKRVL